MLTLAEQASECVLKLLAGDPCTEAERAALTQAMHNALGAIAHQRRALERLMLAMAMPDLDWGKTQ